MLFVCLTAMWELLPRECGCCALVPARLNTFTGRWMNDLIHEPRGRRLIYQLAEQHNTCLVLKCAATLRPIAHSSHHLSPPFSSSMHFPFSDCVRHFLRGGPLSTHSHNPLPLSVSSLAIRTIWKHGHQDEVAKLGRAASRFFGIFHTLLAQRLGVVLTATTEAEREARGRLCCRHAPVGVRDTDPSQQAENEALLSLHCGDHNFAAPYAALCAPPTTPFIFCLHHFPAPQAAMAELLGLCRDPSAFAFAQMLLSRLGSEPGPAGGPFRRVAEELEASAARTPSQRVREYTLSALRDRWRVRPLLFAIHSDG